MNVDVHAWTPEINKHVRPEFFERVEPAEFDQLVAEIAPICSAEALAALQKMQQRYQLILGGYLDPDLQNSNVVAILKYVWIQLKLLKSTELLVETLQDMGQTCVQGDSHRLLFLFSML